MIVAVCDPLTNVLCWFGEDEFQSSGREHINHGQIFIDIVEYLADGSL